MYYDAIPIITVMAMYYGFMFFGKINGTQLIFMKKTHISSLLTLISIALNVGCVFWLARPFGAIGAAWGMFLASLVSGCSALFLSQRYYPIQWETGKMIAIFGSLLVFPVTAILLRSLGVDYGIRIFFRTIFLGIFFYIGVKIQVLSKENILLLRSVFIPSRAAPVLEEEK